MPKKSLSKSYNLPLVDNALDEDRWGEMLNDNFQLIDQNESLEHTLLALKDRILLSGL